MRRGRVELYRDSSGEWRWRIKAANGRTLADSGEGYKRMMDAHRASDVVRTGTDGWVEAVVDE